MVSGAKSTSAKPAQAWKALSIRSQTDAACEAQAAVHFIAAAQTHLNREQMLGRSSLSLELSE